TEFFAEIVVKATAPNAMEPVHATTSSGASCPPCGTKDHLNAFEHAIETRDLLIEMVQAGARYLVHAYAPIRGRRNSPLSLHQSGFQQALKRRVERALLNLQQVVGRSCMCCTSAYPCEGCR